MAVVRALDEALLTASSADTPVQAWDVRTGMLLKSYKTTAVGRGGLCVVGEDYLVAAHVAKNALDVWCFDRESAMHRFHLGEPLAVVAASPDGAFCAAGGQSGAAYLWETATGRLVRQWAAHFKAIGALAFRADGSVLVTGGDDTVVHAWAVATLLDPAFSAAAPMPLHAWSEHALPVTAVCCGGCGGGGGGGLVASVGADRTARLWTLAGGFLLRTIAFPAALTAVAIDACEAALYAGAVDGRIFEVCLNAVAVSSGIGGGGSSGGGVLEGHTRAVSSLSCSADGAHVVSASEDGTARVWDAKSRTTVHVLRHPKAPITAAVLVSRARIAGGGQGGGQGGGGGGGEPRRRLAPLAPFSKYAAGDRSGLKPWEGAPIVLRNPATCAAESFDGGDWTPPPTWDTSNSVGGGKGEKGGVGGLVLAEVESLRVELAAARAAAATAAAEATSWRSLHAELKSFVAEELVTRESAR